MQNWLCWLRMLSLLIFQVLCSFHVFYVWHKLFLSTFLHKSDISSMLQVISVCWESRLQPCEVQRAACRGLQQSQTQRADGGPTSLTSTLKPPQTNFGLESPSWCEESSQESRARGAVAEDQPDTHTVLVPLHHTQLAQSKHKEERKKNSNHGFWWSTRSVKQKHS